MTQASERMLAELSEKVKNVHANLAAWGSVHPGPLPDCIILSCKYFHIFSVSWKKIINDRGNTHWCKECKKTKKR